MKRTEIIDEAKRMVLQHGPSNVLEFGDELFDSHCPSGDPREQHKEAIVAEAIKQARRVYDFLGYER